MLSGVHAKAFLHPAHCWVQQSALLMPLACVLACLAGLAVRGNNFCKYEFSIMREKPSAA
jgi:hypothetical protein